MKQKIRVEGKKIIVSMLVLAGSPVQGIVHTPQQVRKAEPEVVRYYCPWAGYHYCPQKSKKDWYMSQTRKQELLANIAGIRQQIRAKAEKIRVDKNTTVIAYTQQQKDRYKAMRDSEKLLHCIIRTKQIV